MDNNYGSIENSSYENQRVPLETKVAPNGIESLVFGCVSVFTGCFCIGLIFGIIGCRLSSKGLALYNENPKMYKVSGLLTAGRITSIVGLILSICSILFWAAYIFLLVYLTIQDNPF